MFFLFDGNSLLHHLSDTLAIQTSTPGILGWPTKNSWYGQVDGVTKKNWNTMYSNLCKCNLNQLSHLYWCLCLFWEAAFLEGRAKVSPGCGGISLPTGIICECQAWKGPVLRMNLKTNCGSPSDLHVTIHPQNCIHRCKNAVYYNIHTWKTNIYHILSTHIICTVSWKNSHIYLYTAIFYISVYVYIHLEGLPHVEWRTCWAPASRLGDWWHSRPQRWGNGGIHL